MSNRFSAIEPPHTHHLLAVSGWLELGNAAEAEVELNRIPRTLWAHPAVLEARWAIAAFRNEWAEGAAIAQELVDACPDNACGWLHRAYALRRSPGGSLALARTALLPALTLFPTESVIPYNLACYACQMGELEEARALLRLAVKSGGKKHIQSMALADSDLEPLWPEVRTL